MNKEYLDILDENGNKTGEVKLRKEVHRDGDYHRSTHVWVINSNGEILLQRRCATKDTYPNMLDISSAGHLVAGDDSISCALRELKEELDLDEDVENLIFLDTLVKNTKCETSINNEFADIYLYRTTKDIKDMKFQEDEISEIIFVPYKKFKDMVKSGQKDLLSHPNEYELLFKVLDPELDN